MKMTVRRCVQCGKNHTRRTWSSIERRRGGRGAQELDVPELCLDGS